MPDGSGAGGLKLEVKTVLTKVADTSAAAAGGAEKKSTNGASRTRAAAPDSGRRARTGRIDRMELPPCTAAAVGLTADDGRLRTADCGRARNRASLPQAGPGIYLPTTHRPGISKIVPNQA